MNNKTQQLALVVAAVAALSGCVGSNAVTGKLMEVNLKAVDNRYARGGLNILMSPAYGLTIAADYIVFNSVEFWTGKNPLNGKPHIFDSDVDTYLEINHKLDPTLTDAPISPLTQHKVIEQGTFESIDSNTLKMAITYNNGEQGTFVGTKEGEDVRYYLDGELVSETSMSELQAYVKSHS